MLPENAPHRIPTAFRTAPLKQSDQTNLLTDLHAAISDFTTKGNRKFRQHANGCMLSAWMELKPISVVQSAIRLPCPRRRFINHSRGVASANEAFDRASQNSQIS